MTSGAVASFPRIDFPGEVLPDAALALLEKDPYEGMLAAALEAEKRWQEDPMFADPYAEQLRLANPYTEELQLANPYTEELQFANPYRNELGAVSSGNYLR